MFSRRNIYFILYSIVIGALIGGVIACYFIPKHTGDVYLKDLHTATSALDKQMRAQSKLADMEFLGDMAIAPAKFYSQTATAKAGTEKTIQQLASYEKVCEQLPIYGSWAVANTYQKAVASQARCFTVVAQSTEVLQKFSALILYAETQKTKDSDFVVITTDLNSVKDFNNYAGRSDELYQQATKLRQLADDSQRYNAPAEVASLPDAFGAVYRDAAVGFDELAYGILVAQDAPIYSGVHLIEAAVARHDQDLGKTYASAMNGLLILSDVRDLPEKLSLTI